MSNERRDTVEWEEVLLLVDSSTRYYVIPREVLAEHEVTGADLAAVQSALGDDVAGFGMENSYATTELSHEHRADLLREAARTQRAQQAAGAENAPARDSPIAIFIRRARLAGGRRWSQRSTG